MYNTKSTLSLSVVLTVLCSSSSLTQAATLDADSIFTTTVTEVADTDDSFEAIPTPTPDPIFQTPGGGSVQEPGGSILPLPGDPGFGGTGSFGGGLGGGFGGGYYGGGGIGTVLMLGEKIMDFIVTNKPTADYKPLRAAVVPAEATNFAQMKGWSKPVSKVYHVGFKNVFGKDAGGFDYRLSFVYGGTFKGKGKYIGQIAFVPLKMNLKTDRKIIVRAELLEPMNYGTEDDPLAGVQLQINWSSETTLRFTGNSIEYFFYGNGEVQDISNGTGSGKLPQF